MPVAKFVPPLTEPEVLLLYQAIVPMEGDPVKVTCPEPQTLPPDTTVGGAGNGFTYPVIVTLADVLSHPVAVL